MHIVEPIQLSILFVNMVPCIEVYALHSDPVVLMHWLPIVAGLHQLQGRMLVNTGSIPMVDLVQQMVCG